MKLLKSLAFCFLLILGFTAAAKAEDTIYLKDGNVVHGVIIQKFPSGSVKIKTASGKVTVYKKTSIKKIVHTNPSSASMTVAPKKSRHHAEVYSGTINGVSSIGRPGYFYSDTAFTPNKNQIMGSAGLAFYSPGSQFTIPFGVAFGLMDNLQIHASTGFYSYTGVSGLNYLTFGGKYGFRTSNDNLRLAVGLDLADGPLTGSGYSSFNFDPYGIVTYNFPDGFQLNGQLGIEIVGGETINNPLYGISGLGNQPKTISVGGTSYVQLNAGAAYPIADKLTGIAELDINGLGQTNTPLIVGIRTGHDVQLQAFAGLDLASTVGVMIGGNVALVSQ